MFDALRKRLPDWADESRQLSRLSADERAAVALRQRAANESLAPYVGLTTIAIVSLMFVVDIERVATHQFHASLTGFIYALGAAGHLILTCSIAPALALKSSGVAANREKAQRLLHWHLGLLIVGMLILSVTGVVLRGSYVGLACALILTNLLYSLPWRPRVWVNSLAALCAPGAVLLFSQAPGLARLITVSELLTLISLCAVGGAILHRDRLSGHVAQHRESMYLARLRQEIQVAAKLQQSLLPPPWPATPAFDVRGLMRPAQDIGGDFFDHFHVADGSVCLVVADVCGKGIPAGLFGMSAKSVLHAMALQPRRAHAGALVAEVNNRLHEGNEQLMFVTAVYANYQPATGLMEFVNAGHLQPLLIAADGETRWLEAPRGRALGARGGQAYASAQVDLQPGDTVLFITDGITEAMNARLEEFGAARVKAVFDSKAGLGPAECIGLLLAAVDAFTGGVEPSDDITCLAICHRPPIHPPSHPGLTRTPPP